MNAHFLFAAEQKEWWYRSRVFLCGRQPYTCTLKNQYFNNNSVMTAITNLWVKEPNEVGPF